MILVSVGFIQQFFQFVLGDYTLRFSFCVIEFSPCFTNIKLAISPSGISPYLSSSAFVGKLEKVSHFFIQICSGSSFLSSGAGIIVCLLPCLLRHFFVRRLLGFTPIFPAEQTDNGEDENANYNNNRHPSSRVLLLLHAPPLALPARVINSNLQPVL